MSKGKLTNYLRTFRKRSGLTQRELAFLLGVRARGPISSLEKCHRMPLLCTALRLAAIFQIPVEELFAGVSESVATEVTERLETLASELSAKVGKDKKHEYRIARKLAWLRARRNSVAIHDRTDATRART